MNQLIYPLYLSTASLYLFSLSWRPYPFSALSKSMPILLLLVTAVLYKSGRDRWYLVVALLFSAGGDILLDLNITHSFVLGLASFLVAHVFYSALFWRLRNPSPGYYTVAVAILLFGISAAVLFVPKAAALAIPVAAYIAVISVMGVMAALTGNKWLALGAILFILSDAGIAWNRFISSFSFAPFYVMTTYYAAQGLIFFAVIPLLPAPDDGG